MPRPISEEEALKAIAADTLIQAVKDVASARTFAQKLDAVLFLLSESGELFAVAAGLPYDSPLRWVLQAAATKDAKDRYDVLRFFEGLTKHQARQLSRLIIDTLPTLRRQVLAKENRKGKSHAKQDLETN